MMEETKPEGAAVMRTERTEEVGRAEARELARGPRERRTAGSVGRAVMPAREASCRSWETSAWRLEREMMCRSSIMWSAGAAMEDTTRARRARVGLYIVLVWW